MIEYLLKNKEWLFDGVGVFIIGLVITFVSKWISRKRDKDIKTSNPELLRINNELFSDNNPQRVFILKTLAEARDSNIRLEIRHVTDAAEDNLKMTHSKAINEIEKLEEEGIIKFDKKENEILTPYTGIKLTEKYFSIIK